MNSNTAPGDTGRVQLAGSPAEASPAKQPKPSGKITKLLPGLALCLAISGVALGVNHLFPGVSPLIIAIVLGILTANLVPLSKRLDPGINFSAKKLLRLGIVFLGLKLVLADIANLGIPMLIVVVCIVGGGFFGTVLMGKLLGVKPGLTLLVACGFSICGAAAVAGAAGVVDPDEEAEEDTVTAVALVVVFGTIMIPLIPFLSTVLQLDAETAGMWAGGSIHEIAQVVAAGGIIGGGALAVAVIVKLARVLMLAPIVAILSVQQRHKQRQLILTGQGREGGAATKLPPIIPIFIIGFIAMVLIRSFIPLPSGVLVAGDITQMVLLSAAMFALGAGVKVRKLMSVGGKPFVLAALSTVLVMGVSFVGVTLAS